MKKSLKACDVSVTGDCSESKDMSGKGGFLFKIFKRKDPAPKKQAGGLVSYSAPAFIAVNFEGSTSCSEQDFSFGGNQPWRSF